MNKLSDRLSALAECAECNGKGYAEIIEHWERPCDACHGEGYVMTDTQETLREAVARAICENMTLGTGCTKHFYETADAAIATMQPEIDRRVAEERDAVAQWLLQQAGGRPSMFQDRNLSRQIAAREFMYAIQRGDHLTAFQQENSDDR